MHLYGVLPTEVYVLGLCSCPVELELEALQQSPMMFISPLRAGFMDLSHFGPS